MNKPLVKIVITITIITVLYDTLKLAEKWITTHQVLGAIATLAAAATTAAAVAGLWVKGTTGDTNVGIRHGISTGVLTVLICIVETDLLAMATQAGLKTDQNTITIATIFISIVSGVLANTKRDLRYMPGAFTFLAVPSMANCIIFYNVQYYVTELTLLLSVFGVYFYTKPATKTVTLKGAEMNTENGTTVKTEGIQQTGFKFEDEETEDLNYTQTLEEVKLREKFGVVIFESVTPPGQGAHNAADITKYLRKVGVKYPQALAKLEVLKDMKRVLDDEFPWLQNPTKKAVENAIVYCTIHGDAAPLQMRPLLLLGPPGIGKTQWARRFAELSGTEGKIISLAGKSSAQGIRSGERIYSGSGPSMLISEIYKSGVANPVIVLDEIDKAEGGQSGQGGGVQGTLLQLLEKNTAKKYWDDFLEGTVNLAQIIWVATANDKGSVSEPLQSRMDVLDLEGPSVEHAPNLAKTMTKQVGEELNYPELPILKTVEPLIADRLSKKENLREVYNAVFDVYKQQALRKAGLS